MPDTAVLPGRFARQLALPGLGLHELELLRSAHVVVVGAGGVGSALLPALAAAGIGTLTVVDDDVVDLSNLHRQTLHTAADVGRPKVDSALEPLRALATGVVEGIRERVDAANAADLIRSADLVIDATDSIAARYALDDAAAASGIPLVWGSAQGTTGQVGVAWAARGPRFRDLFPVQPDDSAVETCESGGVLPTLCTTVGGLMATEALKVLTGLGTPLVGRLLVIDALAATVRQISYGAADAADAADAGGAAAASPSARASQPASGPFGVEEIDAPALATLLDEVSEGEDDTQLVDVRELWEAEIAALPGSVLIPLGELPDRLGELDRNRPVVTYCHAGMRSAQAAALLTQAGFRARSLRGGIDGWSRTVDPDLPRY